MMTSSLKRYIFNQIQVASSTDLKVVVGYQLQLGEEVGSTRERSKNKRSASTLANPSPTNNRVPGMASNKIILKVM